jgi:DNA-directed RNA polymerase specialized sigma24 family protein
MLELLAKNHKLWIRMVRGFGADYDLSQDIVQSFYLRMHKYVKDEDKIMYNDEEVNRFFCYVTLKNMYRTYVNATNKFTFFEIREDDAIDEELQDFVFDEAMETAFERLVGKISEEMDTWHKYDKILSEKYLKSDYSLRDIANGSGISLTSIFNTMRENKRILKEKFGEDWQDFKNGDYNLIK